MLFLLGTAFFASIEIRAAPTKYDQRQDGEFNLHAKLENFLFVVAFPSNSEHIHDLALGALEEVISRSKDQGLIKSGEAAHQEEPYSVQILQINENHQNKEGSVRKAEEGDAGTLNVSDQQSTAVGQTEKAERIARNMKNFEFPKSREVPTIPGYFFNTRKTQAPKTGNSGRARNVVGNVGNVENLDVELESSGTSLKKQLPQKEEENVALPSSNADKNDVSPIAEEKQQELRLLGDSIENCGPGRRRDASGVCQFDGSGSLL